MDTNKFSQDTPGIDMGSKIYQSHKQVKAFPFTLGDYNDYRNWAMPKDEDPNAEGYLVEYLDGGKPNDPRHEGYISWTPKAQFDNGYTQLLANPSAQQTFSDVVTGLKRGRHYARQGWNGKDMFIFLVRGSTFNVNRPPLLGIYLSGTKIDYRSHIDMRCADGAIVVWTAAQSDILASDWVEIEK